MSVGPNSFGSVPAGSDDETIYSVVSDYDLADATPTNVPRYRVEAFPYDPDDAAAITLRYGQIGADLVLDDPFPPRVSRAFHYSSLVVQGEITSRGGSVPNFGAIRVAFAQNEGDSEVAERCYWDARPVHVFRGFDGLEQSHWRRVLTARALNVNFALDSFTIELRDPSLALQTPLQTATYLGTGLAEGGEGLKGQRKPVCFGPANNVAVRILDEANGVGQWHSTRVQGVRGFFDSGIELDNAGDITDLSLASIWDWVTDDDTRGTFITDNANGLVRWGGALAGLPTIDGDGHIRPGDDSFPNTHATIARAMAQDFAGQLDSDLDLPSFGRMALRNRIEAHYFDAGSETSTIDAIRDLLQDDLLGFASYNANGQLEIGQLRDEPPMMVVRAEELFPPFASERQQTPIKARILEHDRSYTVQQSDSFGVSGQLAGGVDPVRRAYVGQAYRSARAEIAIPERLGAVESTVQTHCGTDADGLVTAEAARQLALLSSNRKPWKVRLKGVIGKLRPGRSLRVLFPRYRFENGRNGIILGITEDSSDESTLVTWWG